MSINMLSKRLENRKMKQEINMQSFNQVQTIIFSCMIKLINWLMSTNQPYQNSDI